MKPMFRFFSFVLITSCCLAQQAVEVVEIMPKHCAPLELGKQPLTIFEDLYFVIS